MWAAREKCGSVLPVTQGHQDVCSSQLHLELLSVTSSLKTTHRKINIIKGMKETTDTRGENVGNRVKTFIQPRQAGQPEISGEGNGEK